jgi:hypothetical protein
LLAEALVVTMNDEYAPRERRCLRCGDRLIWSRRGFGVVEALSDRPERVNRFAGCLLPPLEDLVEGFPAAPNEDAASRGRVVELARDFVSLVRRLERLARTCMPPMEVVKPRLVRRLIPNVFRCLQQRLGLLDRGR